MSHPSMPTDTETHGPLPPQNVEAECSVLGGMMLSKDAIADVVELLRPTDFYRPAHQTIYNVVLELSGRGEPADAITVSAELEQRQVLQRVGGGEYLHTLINTVPTAANASYYAELVSDMAARRRLVEAGTRVAQLGYLGGEGAELPEVIDRAQAAIHEATADPQRTGDTSVSGRQAADELLADLRDDSEPEVIPTGFSGLDEMLGGYPRGEVTVVCGRPGHGKTMLGVSAIKEATVSNGFSTYVFSLEMSRKLLFQRLVATISAHGVDLKKLQKRMPLDSRDWTEIERAYERIADAPMRIETSSYQTTSTIRTALRRHIQQHGALDVVVIDYLGLLTALGRQENRNIAVQEISRELKVVAGELDVAVVLLHQLNRKSTERTDRKPQLADLRDSGAVEQDAFAVVAIQNYQVDDPDTLHLGEADLHVLKNRQGATGTVKAAFQPRFGRLVEMASEGRGEMSPEQRASGGMPALN